MLFAEAVAQHVVGQIGEEKVRAIDSTIQSIVDFLSVLGRAIITARRHFKSALRQTGRTSARAPAIPPYEKLLVEQLGQSPTAARLWANFIRHWGALRAAEIMAGRQASSLAWQISRARGPLVVSRRAEELRELYHGDGQAEIENALKDAAPSLPISDFVSMLNGACLREEEAWQKLKALCVELANKLPNPRGRPISADTCMHYFMMRHFESYGVKQAYTFVDGIGYSDELTVATMEVVGRGDFSPQQAALMRRKEKEPPIKVRDCAH